MRWRSRGFGLVWSLGFKGAYANIGVPIRRELEALGYRGDSGSIVAS
jgi:hypothetical protein